MDLRLYVDNIHRQVAIAAEAGGDEARALAERLITPLDAAIRLSLQDALAAAAEEITTELAPGSVELRLRGRDLEFVVTPAPVETPGDESTDDDRSDGDHSGGERDARSGHRPIMATDIPPSPSVETDDGGMSRINLRMPDQLKARVEQAAASEGISVNSWLVRAASAGLDQADRGRRRDRRSASGGQRYTGWAR